jgi:hypothetical protein
MGVQKLTRPLLTESRSLRAVPASGKLQESSPLPREIILDLESESVTIANALDYGSLQLLAGGSGYLLLNAELDLTFEATGLTGAASTVSMSLGSQATASVGLAGTGEGDLLPITAATGAASTGAVAGSASAIAPAFPASGAGNIFLNMEGENTLDATLVISGRIRLVILEL